MKMDRTNILRLLLGATLAAFVAATAYGDAQKVPPDAASGGGIAASDSVDWTGSHSFLDGTFFSLKDDVDPTKILRFQLSGITAGQTRTITVPDANLTLPTAFIGGSLGATDNVIPRTSGTGGSTLDGGSTNPPTYDDDGDVFINSQLHPKVGTDAAPSIEFTDAASGFGINFTSQNEINIVSAGAPKFGFRPSSSALQIANGLYMCFTDSWSGFGANGVCLYRDGNGSLVFRDGATSGMASIKYLQAIEVNTATKSPATTESGECYTNTGDTDGSTINLPNDPTIGSRVCALLTVSQTVTIVPAAGEVIIDNGTEYSTSCVADAAGESIELVAAIGGSGGKWVPKSKVGTWTCS